MKVNRNLFRFLLSSYLCITNDTVEIIELLDISVIKGLEIEK